MDCWTFAATIRWWREHLGRWWSSVPEWGFPREDQETETTQTWSSHCRLSWNTGHFHPTDAASILLQKVLAKFKIMLESNVSKHLKMKNAGWMGWVASFCGPASIGCAEMLAGLIFLAGLTNQPAFCFKKCWLNSKSCWNPMPASIWKWKMLAGWVGWQDFVGQPAFAVLKCWLG